MPTGRNSKNPFHCLLLATALVVAGCTAPGMKPTSLPEPELPPNIAAAASAKGMKKNGPIMVRIFKEENVLEVWKKTDSGRFALAASYKICKWSGKLGPKFAEGDRQAPEGFYSVRPGQMNPNSSYHLSFDIGYPNAFDRANGRYGRFLMVHGACSSAGCYSMTDAQIEEIYAFAAMAFRGGQSAFQVEAFPFRMTDENMVRYKGDPNMPFWAMLKEGYDTFEETRVPPKVDVCGRRYVFNRNARDDAEFDPARACPPSEPLRDAKAAFSGDAKAPGEFSALLAPGKNPAPSISGVEEAALASDWSFRRARGEPVTQSPPMPSEVSKAVLDAALRPVLEQSARTMIAAAATARRRMPAEAARAEAGPNHPKRF